MNNPTEIIVYRSPLDAMLWDAYQNTMFGTIIGWMCGLAAAVLILIVAWYVGKALIEGASNFLKRKLGWGKRYNSSHYDSAEYNTLADL